MKLKKIVLSLCLLSSVPLPMHAQVNDIGQTERVHSTEISMDEIDELLDGLIETEPKSPKQDPSYIQEKLKVLQPILEEGMAQLVENYPWIEEEAIEWYVEDTYWNQKGMLLYQKWVDLLHQKLELLKTYYSVIEQELIDCRTKDTYWEEKMTRFYARWLTLFSPYLRLVDKEEFLSEGDKLVNELKKDEL